MGIHRTNPDGNFTVWRNEISDNQALSFEALGLLSYLLTKPVDWVVRASDLQARGRCGVEKARRIVRECVSAGYLVPSYIRDASGRITDRTYEVYDTPQETVVKVVVVQNRATGKPCDGKTVERETRAPNKDTPVQSTHQYQGHTVTRAVTAHAKKNPSPYPLPTARTDAEEEKDSLGVGDDRVSRASSSDRSPGKPKPRPARRWH